MQKGGIGFITVFLSGRAWCWTRLLFLTGYLKMVYVGFVDSSGAYLLVAPGTLKLEDNDKGQRGNMLM